MVQVKICGITTLEDARTAVACGADALGFNFYARSPRYLTPSRAREIIDELPPRVLAVGVFVNEASPADVRRISAEACVAAAQLHGDEGPDYCRALAGAGLQVIKALRVGPAYEPRAAARFAADAILLDAFEPGARGGTGQTFDWSRALRTRELVPKLYLAGGLNEENVGRAIALVRPYGVDVCSGVESSPGRKDWSRLRRFIEAARAATESL